jgi:hypothetical protein
VPICAFAAKQATVVANEMTIAITAIRVFIICGLRRKWRWMSMANGK